MKQDLLLKKTPKNILIISMRYLGDVLLTTPLIHSLAKAHPNAKISVLVYSNTTGILEGNPDIDEIISTPQRPKFADYKTLIKQIFRKFDLSISCQAGDRRFVYALLSASTRVAFVPQRNEKGWWKRYLVHGWTEAETHSKHTVLELLKLSTLLQVPSCYALVPPQSPETQPSAVEKSLPDKYAVFHIHPQWKFKRWTTSGWIEIANYLISQSITPVFSGSPAKEEIEYINSIKKHLPANSINIAGKVSLSELTKIISQSQLFIGPDTGITHLAAATGIPVIALFGPTNPLIWGPWPFNYNKNIPPFKKVGNQHVNNIYILQGTDDKNCVPCQEEGCERYRDSHSSCLDNLSSQQVIKFIDSSLK